MTDHDLENFLNSCDDKIKQGIGHTVSKSLNAVYETVKSISNENRVRYCNILYRNGQVSLASKVIYRLATAQPREDHQSQAEIEYAKSLLLLGKHSESKRILKSIDFKKFPLAQYQLGFCFSLQWNFKEAIQQTDEFLKISTESTYFNFLAKLNNMIDIAYMDPSRLNGDEILGILNEIKNNTNYALLQAVGTQVYGRFLLHKKNYSKAHMIFSEGLNLIKNIGSFDRLYLQKWRLVAEFHKTKDQASIKKEFLKLRSEALKLQDDTTARECDFYLGYFFNDLKTARFCYHGTPFPGFKKWVLTNGSYSEQDLAMPALLISTEGICKSSVKPKKIVDSFELPATIQKTFAALTRDFYNPLTLPRMHEHVFPELYWNPFSSPVQMRQLIFRLRQDLSHIDKKIEIKENNQTYRLTYKSPQKILQIQTLDLSLDKNAHLRLHLENKYKNKKFTFGDFQKKANLPKRTAQRRLQELMQSKQIAREGKTRKTKYFLT